MGNRVRKAARNIQSGLFDLVLLSVCFIIGVAIGVAFSSVQEPGVGLTAYLDHFFLSAAGKESAVSLLLSIWRVFRWPLFLMVIGLTPIGILGIPSIFFSRGFFISLFISRLTSIYGLHGTLAGAAMFGVSAFFGIPALFLLGCMCFKRARLHLSIVGNRQHYYYLPLMLICAGALLIEAALFRTIAPPLLHVIGMRYFA